MPELGTRPVNRYLPPRGKDRMAQVNLAPQATESAGGFLGWLDRALDRLG